MTPPPNELRVLDSDLLRALAQTRSFHLGAPHHAAITPDRKAVLFLRSAARDPRQALFEMDLATGALREVVRPEALLAGPETLSPEEQARRERMRVRATGFTSFELSADGASVLVSLSGRLFVVERASGKGRELATGAGAVIDPRYSEDGKRVAFVRDHDLYVVPVAGGAETRVTHGGSERLTHGLAEFVAQEELDRQRGFWWSPDGGHLLYEEADTSKVDDLFISDPAHPDRPPQRMAYPRPGRANAEVRFGIAAATPGGHTVWIDWDRARFPYVAHASWSAAGPVLYVLDRLQQIGRLLSVNPANGKTTPLVEEKDPAWLNVDPSMPRWLPSGKGFLWSSERSGEWQVELRDREGALVRELLPKGFGYVSVAGVDEGAGVAYVVGSADPTRTQLWRVSLDGTGRPEDLVPGAGTVAASFGSGHAAFVSVEGSLGAMPRSFVRSVDGTLAREIPSAAETPSTMPGIEIVEAGADRVRVAVVRPRSFRQGVKYPVLDAAYGGPHHNVVEQSALPFVRAQWMADAVGAIVVAMDARGTPRRGREWERAIHGKLGSVPVEGHVATLQALGEQFPEMDLTRVGVYGWSFGGYFAAMAVLTRPDVFRVAVAGAPPADWRDYDTAYTERYLGLPQQEAAAYDAASLLTYARRPASGSPVRPLLLVHGTADDNVYFLNSLKLADALARGSRPFSFLPLVGTTHMLLDPDQSEVVWTQTAALLRDALVGS